MNASRVLLGVAQAHKMLNSFSKNMKETNRLSLNRLTAWKNIRADEFAERDFSPMGWLKFF